jgi:hypothetical protein
MTTTMATSDINRRDTTSAASARRMRAGVLSRVPASGLPPHALESNQVHLTSPWSTSRSDRREVKVRMLVESLKSQVSTPDAALTLVR